MPLWQLILLCQAGATLDVGRFLSGVRFGRGAEGDFDLLRPGRDALDGARAHGGQISIVRRGLAGRVRSAVQLHRPGFGEELLRVRRRHRHVVDLVQQGDDGAKLPVEQRRHAAALLLHLDGLAQRQQVAALLAQEAAAPAVRVDAVEHVHVRVLGLAPAAEEVLLLRARLAQALDLVVDHVDAVLDRVNGAPVVDVVVLLRHGLVDEFADLLAGVAGGDVRTENMRSGR